MGNPLLTDSGLETWLIFDRLVDLPLFASFPLLEDPDGRELLAEYFRDHLAIASRLGPASSWRHRRGGPAAGGAPSSGTTLRRWTG
jgi:homocysteine S-methyltransferase